MTRNRNVRSITKFKRQTKAISPVIATLLMIAIAVVASLVVYAWVAGYIGFQTSNTGKAVDIPSLAVNDDEDMLIYVQNVGQGQVEIGAVYIDNSLIDSSYLHFNPNTVVPQGDTVEITVDGPYDADTKYGIKVTTTDGTSMTSSLKPGSGNSGGSQIPGNADPVADFTYQVNGLAVQFTDASSDSDGTIDAWSWTFGDGQTSTAQSPSHTYASANTYSVTLTVTDDDAATNSDTQSVTVLVVQQQVTYVSAGSGSGQTGGNNPTPGYPSGMQANDLILLQVVVRDTSTTPSTPSGFTLLYGPDSNGFSARQWIFYKYATGTETGTLSVSIPGSSARSAARMYAFHDVALSSFSEGAEYLSDWDDIIDTPTVATTGNLRLAVAFVFVDDNVAIDSFNGESGGNWQEQAEYQYNPQGDDLTLDLQTAIMASGGTISGGSDDTGNNNYSWGVRAFALKP